MPTHAEKRPMPYTPDQMYRLVADIEKYPEFLPWTAACRVRGMRPAEDLGAGAEVIDADLVISFKVFRERFGSRVTLRPADSTIDVEYLDGPFKYLNNHWRFVENADGSCTIDFFVDFEFKSRMLQSIVGVVFDEAVRRLVGAFERRADALYGRPAGAAAPA
ncbi:MAG: type II toxin-antitoxin system RatA family toxin [Pseudomonadota bacterium]